MDRLQELAAIKQQVSIAQAAEELEQLRQQTTQQQQQIDSLKAELEQANDRLKRIAETAQSIAPLPASTPQSTPTQPPQASAAPQPPSQPSSPQSPQPHPSQIGKLPTAKLSPTDRVPLAIAAMMHHNQNCPPLDRWFLSGNVIATAAGANPALVVTPWLQTHPSAVSQIDHHNTAIGLNSRSNGKDKDRGQLKAIYQQFIQGKSFEELQQIARQFETQPEAVK